MLFFSSFTAPHKFYIGFRYVNPLTEDAIEEMERWVIRVFLYAYRRNIKFSVHEILWLNYIRHISLTLTFVDLVISICVLVIFIDMEYVVKGCDSNFEVKCSNYESPYKWNNSLVFTNMYFDGTQKFRIKMTNNLTDMIFSESSALSFDI